jgi:tetratricopeptide (TPR) repeat protein
MPSAYTRRWVAAASRATGEGQRLRLEGVRASLRAQALLAREEFVGARAALEEATRAEPRLIGAQLLLASLYEQAGEYPQAMERYRSVLRQKRDDVVALNNLAYHLAAREQKPGEALELAERARLLAPRSPSVLDTLAWVYHLLGEHETAVRYMEDALRASRSSDLLVHAAAIYEAVGRAQDARRALDEAVKQRPDLEHSADVQELRRKLAGAR